MAKAKEHNPPEYRIIHIDLLEKQLTRSAGSDFEQGYDFKFDIGIDNRIDVRKNHLVTECSIRIKDKESLNILGFFTCILAFEFKNHRLEIENENLNLPPEVLTSISRETLSTIRGILYSELRGSHLHYAFLPLLDVDTVSFQKK